MYVTSEEQKKRALLVTVYTGGVSKETAEEHVAELALLAETFGLNVVGKEVAGIRHIESATFVTTGKLEELVKKAAELKADLVVFDDEIAPSQQRNLEKVFGRPVIDRTEVILGVFAARAQTKEARLQIELASIKYQAPRLKRLWSHLSRQAGTGSSGGGGYLKGEGEKQIEIDRRILKKKINDLEKELKEVRASRQTLRVLRARSEVPTFAIIGYTNAGKSTLLNALTQAGVLVEDKLFATLDTTTRKYTLKNNQDILLIDTVGFIRKLPHLLVAAFKSTLEEALSADILLHLIDASHPMALEQAQTAIEVLKELGAEKKPILTLLNKTDLLATRAPLDQLRLKYPFTVPISALRKEGFDQMEELMIKELSKLRRPLSLRIAQSDYPLVAEIQRHGLIHKQEYEGNDILLEVEVPVWLANKFLIKS